MERFWYLSTGERIRIRRLSPGLRIRLSSRTGESLFLQRLVHGMVSPRMTMKKASSLLKKHPFRALEMVRAIQQFTAESDYEELEAAQQRLDEQFLLSISMIEKVISRS